MTRPGPEVPGKGKPRSLGHAIAGFTLIAIALIYYVADSGDDKKPDDSSGKLPAVATDQPAASGTTSPVVKPSGSDTDKTGTRVTTTAGDRGTISGGSTTTAKPRNADKFQPPALKPIPVAREKALVEATVDAKTGGVVGSPDGLSIKVPPGSLDQPRSIKVFSAKIAPPPITFVPFGGEEEGRLEVLRAWDIDAGPDTGLYSGAVEVSLDIPDSAKKDGHVAKGLFVAFSADGKQWEFPQVTLADGKLYNPLLGRRYIIIGANLDKNDIYATALHELFHHYQGERALPTCPCKPRTAGIRVNSRNSRFLFSG